MLQVLSYLILYGAIQALVISVGVVWKANKSEFHYFLIFMMIALAFWQGYTALCLLGAPEVFLGYFSIAHFCAMCSFPFLFYGYCSSLFFPAKARRFLWMLAGSGGLFALVACWFCLLVFDDSAHWHRVTLATFMTSQEDLVDGRLRFISLFPRPLSLLAGLFISVEILRISQAGGQIKRLRINTLILLSLAILGTGVSFYAQLTKNLMGLTHAYGATFISASIVGLFIINQKSGFFLEGTNSRRTTRLTSVDLKAVASVLDRLMKTDRIYLMEDLTISVLARSINTESIRISPEQLSEFINLQFGKNFNQYINGYRIAEACDLLKRTDRTILSIALDVGFNSKSTFNAVFKENIKMSPKDFRLANQKSIL